MKQEYLKIIQEIENTYLSEESLMINDKIYKKISFYHINSFKFPFELYRQLSGTSSIRKFFRLDLRSWSIWIFSCIKTKSFQKRQLIDLIGVIPSWFFIETIKLPLHSNFIYYRGKNTALLYPDHKEPFVVKIKIFSNLNNNEKTTNSEVETIKIANAIRDCKVKTPLFISCNQNNQAQWFMQEMVNARDIGSIPSYKRRTIYNDLFEFMIKFYTKNGVELVYPKIHEFVNIDNIYDYLIKDDNGKSLLKKIDKMLSKNRKMLYALLHNDLYNKNILFDRDDKIWIIDWGNSERGYLVHDFRNKNFDKQAVFNRILYLNEIREDEIYSLEEQIFLENFLDTCFLLNKIYSQEKGEVYKQRIKKRFQKLNQSFNAK